MKHLFKIFTLIVCLDSFGQTGNAGININTPDATSVLDIYANDKGILLPRVSLDSVNGKITPINLPTEGLLVWNNNPNVLYGNGVGSYYFYQNKWNYVYESQKLDDCYDKGGDGVGYFINADAGPVHIQGGAGGLNDGLLMTSKLSLGNTLTTVAGIPSGGDGTVFYYNPKLNTFRSGRATGTNWDVANTGKHSFAVGLNGLTTGNRSFSINNSNTTTDLSSGSFNSLNVVNGENSLSFGNSNTISTKQTLTIGSLNNGNGYHSTLVGVGTRTRVHSEAAFGTYNALYTKVDATGGPEPDNDPITPEGTDSKWVNYTNDRVFSVGYGTSTLTAKTAYEVIKNGNNIVNQSYILPTADGTNDFRLKTDGLGNLTWEKRVVETTATSFSVNTNTVNYNVPTRSFTTVPSSKLPFEYLLFDTDGDGKVEIKVMVNYSGRTLSTTLVHSQIQVISNLTTSATPLIANGAFTFNNTTSPNGAGTAYTTNWIELNSSNTSTLDFIYFEARNRPNSGGTASTLTIEDITFTIRDK